MGQAAGWLGAALVLCLWVGSAVAATAPLLVPPDRLRLAQGAMRLAGVVVPAEPATAAQAEALARRWVEAGAFAATPAGRDRHGVAVVRLERGLFDDLAEALVGAGLAYASGAGDAAGQRRLLDVEAGARTAGRGLWAVPTLATQPAEGVAPAPARFVRLAGRLVAVTQRERWTYLEFGPDWRTDTTVRLAPALAKGAKRRGHDLPALVGRTVAVRGWLAELNGPLIEVADLGQVEVLE